MFNVLLLKEVTNITQIYFQQINYDLNIKYYTV